MRVHGVPFSFYQNYVGYERIIAEAAFPQVHSVIFYQNVTVAGRIFNIGSCNTLPKLKTEKNVRRETFLY